MLWYSATVVDLICYFVLAIILKISFLSDKLIAFNNFIHFDFSMTTNHWPTFILCLLKMFTVWLAPLNTFAFIASLCWAFIFIIVFSDKLFNYSIVISETLNRNRIQLQLKYSCKIEQFCVIGIKKMLLVLIQNLLHVSIVKKINLGHCFVQVEYSCNHNEQNIFLNSPVFSAILFCQFVWKKYGFWFI